MSTVNFRYDIIYFNCIIQVIYSEANFLDLLVKNSNFTMTIYVHIVFYRNVKIVYTLYLCDLLTKHISKLIVNISHYLKLV